MPVNQTLAQYSDWSYFSAFALYALALLLFIAYYVRRLSALEARMEARAGMMGEKVLVGSGASADSVADAGRGGDSVAGTGAIPDTYDANEHDPEAVAEKFRKAASIVVV